MLLVRGSGLFEAEPVGVLVADFDEARAAFLPRDRETRLKELVDLEAREDAHRDLVWAAARKIGDSTVLASDGRCGGKPNFEGISLSLHAKSEAEAKRLYGALADGGQAQMPLAKTFFSPSFGMLADRFGVNWMVIAAQG